MVLPEGTPPDATRHRGSRSTLVVVAVVALGIGVIAVTALTSPEGEPVTEPTTTTTSLAEMEEPIDPDNFDVDEIATGKPLTWESTLSVADGSSLGFVRSGDWTYAFATRGSGRDPDEYGGLHVWRSLDTITWDDLGEAIGPTHLVRRVGATYDGLVALGVDHRADGLTVWRSADGVVWSAEHVPADGLSSVDTVMFYGAAATETTFVMVGDISPDVSRAIADRLDEIPLSSLESQLYDWNVDTTDDQEVVFQLWGPLGFPLFEVTGTELGLSEEERQDFIGRQGLDGGSAEVWVFAEDSEWITSTIHDMYWMESIVELPTGGLIASGGGYSGTSMWASPDGIVWEKLPPSSYPGRIELWQDHLIGSSGSGRVSFLESTDGREWSSIDAPELPDPFEWYVNDFAAGEGGIVAVVSGWPRTPQEDTPPDPAVITSGDSTLTIDHWSGNYRIDVGDRSHTWSMNSGRRPEGVEVDAKRGIIVFSDPETGDRLDDYSIADINASLEDYWATNQTFVEHHALLFSPDAQTWTIQSVDDAVTRDLVVTTDRVAAITTEFGSFDPSPGFEIWSAAIP